MVGKFGWLMMVGECNLIAMTMTLMAEIGHDMAIINSG